MGRRSKFVVCLLAVVLVGLPLTAACAPWVDGSENCPTTQDCKQHASLTAPPPCCQVSSGDSAQTQLPQTVIATVPPLVVAVSHRIAIPAPPVSPADVSPPLALSPRQATLCVFLI